MGKEKKQFCYNQFLKNYTKILSMVYAVSAILMSVFISWHIRLMFKVHSVYQLAKLMSKY